MVENDNPIIGFLLDRSKLEQTESQHPGLNRVVTWDSWELGQLVLQASDDSRTSMKADGTGDVKLNGCKDRCDGIFVIGQFQRSRLAQCQLPGINRYFFLVLL